MGAEEEQSTPGRRGTLRRAQSRKEDARAEVFVRVRSSATVEVKFYRDESTEFGCSLPLTVPAASASLSPQFDSYSTASLSHYIIQYVPS